MPFDAMPQDDAERTVRLLELCRVIEGVADDAFDLRDWNQNGVCRTVACAVGWAMKDEWFRQQGLGRDGKSPSFGADKGWKAVRAFFGVDREEALYMFHAGKYERATRDAVVARIREGAARR